MNVNETTELNEVNTENRESVRNVKESRLRLGVSYSDIHASHLADSFQFPGSIHSTFQTEIINSKVSHIYEQTTKLILCSYDLIESHFTNRHLVQLPLLVV